MFDPIQQLFDMSAGELFAKQEFIVRHGPLSRLPEFMRTGPMRSIDSLCRHYTGGLEVAGGSKVRGTQTSISGIHASALLAMGLTVYFRDMKGALPESKSWLHALETALAVPHCAALVAFANSAGSGLSLHHDQFDQLFFQIQGEKQFHYVPNRYVENPDVQFSTFGAASTDWGQVYRRGFPVTSEEVLNQDLQTIMLHPGSIFFMPAGTWHTTAEQENDALSLAVAVRAPSRLMVLLNQLRYYAVQSPEWRARPYGGWAGDSEIARKEHLKFANLLGDLAERMKRLSAAEAFQAWSADGYATGLYSAYPKDAKFQRYIRIPNSSVHFEEPLIEGKIRCVVLSGSTHRPQNRVELAFHPEARKVVEWILDTRAQFSVAEVGAKFPEFTRDDLEAFLDWLGQAALIRPIPVPEWDAD